MMLFQTNNDINRSKDRWLEQQGQLEQQAANLLARVKWIYSLSISRMSQFYNWVTLAVTFLDRVYIACVGHLHEEHFSSLLYINFQKISLDGDVYKCMYINLSILFFIHNFCLHTHQGLDKVYWAQFINFCKMLCREC